MSEVVSLCFNLIVMSPVQSTSTGGEHDRMIYISIGETHTTVSMKSDGDHGAHFPQPGRVRRKYRGQDWSVSMGKKFCLLEDGKTCCSYYLYISDRHSMGRGVPDLCANPLRQTEPHTFHIDTLAEKEQVDP